MMVVWDGTPDAACGTRYLRSEPEAVLPEKPAPRRDHDTTFAERVLITLKHRGPQTMRELATHTGLTIDQVNGALYTLMKREAVRVTGFIESAADRRWRNASGVKVYGATSR